MSNILEVIKNFFKANQFYYDLVMGLGTTFIGFLIVLLVFGRKKLVISDKISVSVNKSCDRQIGEPAWKFKIINKSLFIKFYNFDVKLYGINYITSADNTKTEHKKMIESLAGIRELGCYIPGFILKMIRKKNKDYAINFAYRPLTYHNLMELSKEFEVFELSVFATDSLTGRLHFVKKTFHPAIFVEGDFTNDGNLNQIESKKIPDEVWKNYKKKQKKENSKMRKIIAAFFIVTAAAVCAFAQSDIDSNNAIHANEDSWKIGDFGPGGGIVFKIEDNQAWECSEVLGKRTWNEAKILCREYRGNTYENWYLPSKDELDLIYQNLIKKRKMFVSDSCWSSSVYSDDEAYSMYLAFGECFRSKKSEYKEFIMAVRDFDINEKKVSNKNIVEKKSRLDERKKQYKIGDIGPGGGIVYFVKSNEGWECSKEVLGCKKWNDAIKLCEEYRGSGYNDWYLPNEEDLQYIYENLIETGKRYYTHSWFWSSTYLPSISRSYARWLGNGSMKFFKKNEIFDILAVRYFRY